jgi:predicted RNA binding protein YcfA (HicA-like mRNA interferase family)
MRRLELDGRINTFPVPVHSGKTVKQGTLHGILRKAGIDPERLSELL